MIWDMIHHVGDFLVQLSMVRVAVASASIMSPSVLIGLNTERSRGEEQKRQCYAAGTVRHGTSIRADNEVG